MANHLFLPIPNIRGRWTSEPDLNDPYILEGIAAFKASGNPAENVIVSEKKIDWGGQRVGKQIEIEYAERFKQVLARVFSKAPKPAPPSSEPYATLRAIHL